MPTYKPVLLMILDGWGIREMEHGNAVLQAKTPNYDRWQRTRERAVLGASGEAVGLVPEQMGNSEVGHLNLGAGRIIFQDITRINNAISDQSFYNHPALINAIHHAEHQGKKLHFLGLLGTGGVHAHDDHLYALLDTASRHAVKPIIHVITDGRDTSPGSAQGFLESLEDQLTTHGGVIATLSGRYYAMDRDQRWERTTLAYSAMVKRRGETAKTAADALRQSYEKDVTDEFILPTVIEGDNLAVEAGDVLVCYNFRADRMRQIVRLFTVPEFENRPDVGFLDDLTVLTFTEYATDLPAEALYPLEIISNPLAEVLSKQGRKQFHIAETEKYPHVTYFFNGRSEEPFDGEDRTIVPSPKVATYDLQPEMSAEEVTQTILDRINNADDDFLLINFANPDMVGHTGSLEAAIKACETVDDCAGRIVQAINNKGGIALVTADHGNAERMIDEVSGDPHTYHTTSGVPFFAICDDYIGLRPRGILADVAPTVLDLLGIEQPKEMTGRSLIHFEL
jgi:2,3-bisphosphoglycerate-independent phosphoglycerate mutase